jgi:hypothetical protein
MEKKSRNIEEAKSRNIEEANDEEWITDLVFLVDVTGHLNNRD